MKKILLFPFSFLYGLVVFVRNQLYDLNIFKSKDFDVPVISIGNITVGGTGKTPHVEYLIQLLKDRFKVATLSRGYKRKTKGFVEVKTNSKVTEVGDESLQVKKKYPGVQVAVCENRVKGASQIFADKNPADVLLLDDAFQHRRIESGINILLIDYNRQLKEDSLLPAGRLREPAAQMKRANVIIFTKCPEEITPIMRRVMQTQVRLKPYQELFFTTLEYGMLQPVFNAPEIAPGLLEQKKHNMLVVTGIASPNLIYTYLNKIAGDIVPLAFSDHRNFSASDILKMEKKFQEIVAENKLIITTEKDAIRFRDMEDELDEQFRQVIYYLPVKVRFLDEEGKLFNKKILNYVGENKSNRELHQRKNKGNA